MATPTLQTERLTLRPVLIQDAPAIQQHFDNWNIMKHLTAQVPWPYPADGAETFIKDVALPGEGAGTALSWAITETGGRRAHRFDQLHV